MNDLISVIIPIHNSKAFLKKCVLSVLNQTYKHLEIILINDGSTDGSGIICNSFNDSRIRVFHNDNMGLSFSRQFGIDKVNGTFFVTIDSDDWIKPNFIFELYSAIKHYDSDISVCNRYDFSKGKKRPILKNLSSKDISITKDMIKSKYFKLCSLLGLSDSWDKMYRTDFVRSSNVKFNLPKQYNGNDLLFNYKLIMHCPKYSIIDEPLLMHRLTKGSMVRKPNKNIVSGFECIIEELKKESLLFWKQGELDYELSKVFSMFAKLVFIRDCNSFNNWKNVVKDDFYELRNYVLLSNYLSFTEGDALSRSVEIDVAFREGDCDKLIKYLKKYKSKQFIKKLLGII